MRKIRRYQQGMLPWGKRAENVKRAEDILAECCKGLDLGEKTLGKSGRDWVGRRRWPGDDAEMRRLIYYAALSAPGYVIEAVHFPPRGALDHEAFAHRSFEDIALRDVVDQKISHFFERLGKVEVTDLHRTVIYQVETSLIGRCLDWAKGNRVKAARVLGINRNTLRRKMRELGIE